MIVFTLGIPKVGIHWKGGPRIADSYAGGMPNESIADTPVAGKALWGRCIGCEETLSPGLLAVDEPEGGPSLVVTDNMSSLSCLKLPLVGRPKCTGTREPMVGRGNGEIDIRSAKGEWVNARRRWDRQRIAPSTTRKIRPPTIPLAMAPLRLDSQSLAWFVGAPRVPI